MDNINIPALTSQVLWAAFGLAVIFGAIAQRSHFCTMGAISDVVNMRDWTRVRQWACALGVAMLGFTALVSSGQIDPNKTLYALPRWMWLSTLVGGLLFGFGMVLASGCGSKTLIRIGSGNLKSVVVFVVMGVAAFATLKGITAVVRVATVDRVTAEWALPYAPVVALLLGLGLTLWALMGKDFRSADNLLAGIGVGAVITAMWWVSGHLGHVIEHPDTLQEAFLATNSGRAEAMSFVSPIAYTLDWLQFFSDKSKVLTLGIVSVVGVIVGSAITALVTGSFRWEGFGGNEDLANHLVGAVLMGVGGVTAMGCTIGQGLSGLSTLHLNSLMATCAIVLGALAAFKYQTWRL